jgi:hypothetical protein
MGEGFIGYKRGQQPIVIMGELFGVQKYEGNQA